MSNALIAVLTGGLLAVVGLVLCILSTNRRGLAVGGAFCLALGLTVGIAGSGIASPVDPYDPIKPVTTFGKAVQISFAGTPEEADQLGALFTAWGQAVMFDGSRAAPQVTTLEQFYQRFQEAQRFQKQSETPWGNRLVPLSRLVAAEMRQRGVADRGPIDMTTRPIATGVWKETGAALEAID